MSYKPKYKVSFFWYTIGKLLLKTITFKFLQISIIYMNAWLFDILIKVYSLKRKWGLFFLYLYFENLTYLILIYVFLGKWDREYKNITWEK
jgi:hypothetical protein